MSWTTYRVVLRPTGPLHIGAAKIGNLQRTRPYVIGRTLWGALTMRLARDRPAAPAAADYVAMGKRVHEALAFTYFYVTLDPAGQSEPPWPWAAEEAFGSRYLAGYAATATEARGQSAAATTLHEIEQILPVTRDGRPVYLVGYVFERDDADGPALDWRGALNRLQLGGERSYGWGGVRVARVVEKLPAGQAALFGRADVVAGADGDRPVVRLEAGAPLLAHTVVDPGLPVRGRVEPLVGRVWADGDGRRPDYSGLCYLPGGAVAEPATVAIDRFGIWRRTNHAGPSG